MFVGFVIVGGFCLVCCCLVVLALVYVYGCGWIGLRGVVLVVGLRGLGVLIVGVLIWWVLVGCVCV